MNSETSLNTYIRRYFQASDDSLTEAEVTSELEEIFSDGYIDTDEYSYLVKAREYAGIENNAKLLLARLETERIFDKRSYERFKTQAQQYNFFPKPTTYDKVTANILSINELRDGAFNISLSLKIGDKETTVTLELPDVKGKLPSGKPNNDRGLKEDLLSRILNKLVSTEFESGETQFSKEQLQAVNEAVGRLGNRPLSERTMNTSCHIAQTAEGNLKDVLVKDLHKKYQKPVTVEYGLKLYGDIDQDFLKSLGKELQHYPDYIRKLFSNFDYKIYVFDAAEIYGDMAKRGIVTEQMQSGLSLADSEAKGIYYDKSLGPRGFVHELFHALHFSVPSHLWPLQQDYANFGGPYQIYSQAYLNTKYYPEQGFTTRYQFTNVYEFVADGGVVYYRDTADYGNTGDREEMKQEDPMQFLMWTAFDALARASFESPDEQFPPFWAAFTETARSIAEQHVNQFGNSWADEDNLKIFTQEILNMDLESESIFWQGYSQAIDFTDNNTRDVPYDEFIDTAKKIAAKYPYFDYATHIAKMSELKSGDQLNVTVYVYPSDAQAEPEETSVIATVESIDSKMVTLKIPGWTKPYQMNILDHSGYEDNRSFVINL